MPKSQGHSPDAGAAAAVQLIATTSNQGVHLFVVAAAAGAAALATVIAGVAIAGGTASTPAPMAGRIVFTPPAAPRTGPAASVPVEDGNKPLRITGPVGADLTQALRNAGVPEAQGRAYVAALAGAIDLNTGLSAADRYDLVIERQNGRLGELVYAGLNRIGRSDVELMQWTQGKRTRWVDAQTLGQQQGMEMPVAGRISSGFGERFHPILHTMRMHDGVDLAAAWGTPIVAAADGRVTSAGWRGGYGRAVQIAHSGGIETLYGHMSRIAAQPGEAVHQGQVIGYVGASGLATGPHLHYEVHKDGRLVNPLSVNMVQSPIKGEELHAFDARLRGLLMAGSGA